MQTQKLIKKIDYSYKIFLESYVNEIKMALVFSVPKISIKWNENAINSFQVELRKLAEKYDWLKLNTVKTIKWTIVDSLEFEDNLSYLNFIKKTKDFNDFSNNIDYIRSNLIILKDWIIKNPQKINENNNKWIDIIKVIKYFLFNSKSNLYSKELPIQISSKFIENNKKIIDEILQFINIKEDNAFNFNWNSFEERYSLKTKPSFIRFRYLDNEILTNYLWIKIDDTYLKVKDFEYITINCERVYIIENEINYLTFPYIKKWIVIWWKWFNIFLLKNTKWLENKKIFYFWDLDSHWFKILSICRKYFPQTKSIFMNKQTYEKFSEFNIKWKILWKEESKNLKNYLTNEEFELFSYFNKNNLRLEQENISHDFIKEHLKNYLILRKL